MKRRYMAVLLAVFMLGLTACGGKEAADTSEEKEETTEETIDDAGNAEDGPEYKQVSYADLTSTLIRLGEYQGVEVERIVAQVTDEDVEAEIWEIQKGYAELVDVDRAAGERDVAVIEYTGYVDGETSDHLQGTYSLEIGSDAFISGFEEQLMGAVAGEDREVNVTFPEDYYKELAGKDARFDVHVQSVQEYVLDDWNDDFIKENLGYEDEADLKASIQADLEDAAEEEADANLEYDLILKVLDTSEFEIQEEDVTAYTDEMLWSQFRIQAYTYGIDWDTFLADYVGMTEEELRERYRENAIFRIKMVLALHDIADQEGIEISDEELEDWKQEMIGQYGYESKEAVEEAYHMDLVVEQLMQQKAFDVVREKAVIR